jgi:hypothetical protein
MKQPLEMQLNLPMEVANGVISTTTRVWDILVASRNFKKLLMTLILKELILSR